MPHDLAAGRLFEEAIALFASRGYAAVTPADIAAAAGCPLDDLYRHFPRQERFVLKLYEQLASDLESRAAELPVGTVAERFAVLLRGKLALLDPHWELLRSLLPVALDPRNRLAVFGPTSDRIRARVQGVIAAAVYGGTDAPPGDRTHPLVRFLYATHLMCVLLALQDQTPDRALSSDAEEFATDLAGLATRWFARGRPGPLGRFVASLAGLPDLSALADRADRLAGRLVEPPHDPAHYSRAENILRDLFRHRRLQPGAGACGHNPCPQCLALHLPRVSAALTAGEPVRLVLPAFPAKSANPKKTLGTLPDPGEELALRFLQEACEAIRLRHPPGARLTICSDGRVFNDLVGVDDGAVTAYRARLLELIGGLGLTDFEVFDLDDVRPGEAFGATRRWLMDTYGEPLEALTERTRAHDHHKQMFNGIHRFLTEDLAAREPSLSKNQARERSRTAAYEVIRRSNAWSRLVAVYFPEALRLSIHPQPPHSEKVGIMLTPAEDAWLTPWHGVALLRGDRFVLTSRAEAEALGASVVERDGRPSHFELAGATPSKEASRGR
ncbi:L-tyrosine/L-tryptophan isonitrile synthase family protein [Gemmata sp.]|uniref:L-tyrosine/L-tryptophan isonitrile synthase family protein n=1 Tax=Gemmata sp. TaxID=1914242 RepID=UPI003F721186